MNIQSDGLRQGGRALGRGGERFIEDHLVEIIFHFIQALAIYS
jgi:hypothetical protein